MAKDLEAPKPFAPSVFADGDKLDAGNVEEMRFGLAGSGPLAKAVLDSNNVGALRQLSAGLTPTTTIPVGTISPYAGTSAPANWLLCDGSAVSQTTYAALFAVIGPTYNTGGEAAGDFRIPDLRGRVVAGKDDMGGSAASRLTAAGSGITGTTLGAAGGTQTHTLTTAQMPSHSHGGATNLGTGPLELTDGRDLVYTNAAAGTGTFGTAPGTSNLQVQPHAHGINAEGGGGAHQNTQPTLVTTYIIKAIADVTNTFGVALAGAAGGDLIGSYPNPTITNITNAPVHNSNSTLSFRTSSTERMSVDAGGRLSLPYQPAASGWMDTGAGSLANVFYVANNLVTNRGGHYNTSNGRFTCPVAGAYAMFYQTIAWASPGYGYVDVYKNGAGTGMFSHYNLSGLAGGSNWANLNVNAVINCAANDYLQFYIRTIGGNNGAYAAAHNNFSIFYLG